MRFLVLLLVFCGESRATPQYSAATVVQSATGLPVLAANTFASIYGQELAYATRSLQPGDMAAGLLPLTLPPTGTRVLVNGIAAPIWYASPTQVNFLIPSFTETASARVRVTVDGKAGPEVEIRLERTAPGLFPSDPDTALAIQLDGTLIQHGSPAKPGQDVVLFATGLGFTAPPLPYRELANGAAPLARRSEFQVSLDGVPVPAARIRYAGAAPGFAGVYQINLWLPEDSPRDPEIRIAVGDAVSPIGLRLPLR